MTASARLKALAADPTPAMTARGIIEARLGRPLGDLRTLKREQPDTYHALRLLALSIQRARRP